MPPLSAMVDSRNDALVPLADRIWELAEMRFEERQSSALLAEAFEREGFVVERKVAAVTASKTSPTLEDRLVGLWPYVESLLSQGFTLRAIAERVEAEGFTTSTGKPISHQQLHRMVRRCRSC